MFYLKWVTFRAGNRGGCSQAGDYILSHERKMWDQNGKILIFESRGNIVRYSIFDTRVLARIPESVIYKWRNYFGDNDFIMI